MKQLFAILAMISMVAFMFGQSPEKMSYQAVVRNSTNQLVTNHAVGIKISILQETSTGKIVYQETYNPNPQTNDNGLVMIEIGSGIPITGIFTSIDWSSGPYFLKTETDPTGGTNYTITGTSQLLSVPYAIYSETAGNGLTTDDVAKLSSISIGAEVNVNADWNATSGDAQIFNKPNTLSGYGITDAVTTTDDQTIAGNKSFTGIITVPAPSNANDAANKAYVDALKSQIAYLETMLINSGQYILYDADGNQYNVIIIGLQLWMLENLKTTKYNDGTPIENITDPTEWQNANNGAYCWYGNNEVTYKNSYGALYNYYTVKSNKLCPSGWHVPTDADWVTLATYLGGNSVAGGKLKEDGITHWESPNTDADNKSGFTALPGGYRYAWDGGFIQINKEAHFWSSSSTPGYNSHGPVLMFNASDFGSWSDSEADGSSVRCLKD